jgi:hypothetical protein
MDDKPTGLGDALLRLHSLVFSLAEALETIRAEATSKSPSEDALLSAWRRLLWAVDFVNVDGAEDAFELFAEVRDSPVEHATGLSLVRVETESDGKDEEYVLSHDEDYIIAASSWHWTIVRAAVNVYRSIEVLVLWEGDGDGTVRFEGLDEALPGILAKVVESFRLPSWQQLSERLRHEARLALKATRSRSEVQDVTPLPPIIWSHGKGSYSRDKLDQFTVSDEFDKILQLFLKEPKAMQTEYIQGEAAVANVAKTFAAMKSWNNGILSSAIRAPDGVKNAGYFVRVRAAI